MRLALPLIAVLLTLPLGELRAAEADPPAGDERPPQMPPFVKIPLGAPLDALGRPFPNERIIKKAEGWIAGGAILTGAGAGLLVAGLFVGSAAARGEIEMDRAGGAAIGGLFLGGGLMAAIGVPILSAGTFTVGQMKRTIKGAEKVPRTVANEPKYWDAYLQRQFGQAGTILGGGNILLGTVALAAVGATLGTDRHRPSLWAAPIGLYVAGGLMVALGILQQKNADKKMEAIQDEKDPMRWGFSARPVISPPTLALGPAIDGEGFDARLGWSFRF